jgi:hypothetical protein
MESSPASTVIKRNSSRCVQSVTNLSKMNSLEKYPPPFFAQEVNANFFVFFLLSLNSGKTFDGTTIASSA